MRGVPGASARAASSGGGRRANNIAGTTALRRGDARRPPLSPAGAALVSIRSGMLYASLRGRELMGEARIRPYCLRCFAPLVPRKSLCGACGFTSTTYLRRSYWNRNPRILLVQRVLQVAACIPLVPATFLSPVAGIVVGIPVYYTLAKLTEPVPHFRARLFWSILFLAGAILLEIGAWTFPVARLLSLASLVGAGLVLLFARWFDRWRARIFAEGARRVPDPEAALAGRVHGPREVLEAGRPYCLRCFATREAGSDRCPECGFASRSFDRERYWNLSPGLRLLEHVLRVPILLALVVGGLGVSGVGLEREIAWPLFLGSIVLVIPAWWSIGRLTRNRPAIDFTAFWALLLLAAGAALVRNHRRTALAVLVAALVVIAIGILARRWKARLIDVGPAEVAGWEG
jgi:hypothetical protein